MIAQRILAVLAATFLVGAVALATLEPPLLPLGQALLGVDRDLLRTAHDGTVRYLGPWIWDDLAQPVLARPAWLLPASLGLIRQTIWAGLETDWAAQLHRERLGQRIAGKTDDFVEGVSAFLQKRPAAFKGR